MRFLIPAFLALACTPAALLAQEVVQPLPGTTDADRLAEQMRALAINPRDVNALIQAGELSLTLGDLSGAASLFARAERVDGPNPRIKAGEGAILVRSERPGEALRYFAQAEAKGLGPRYYAADRGLAYDLIGQQERAQRDYRLALRNGADDEVTKRYALSLGIAGKREAALEQLDPLLRKTDRSAWRIRAFILAMGGDQAAAEKIATTMLPPGMAQGLQPFFQRLPMLPPVDRAFAVHFGEVHATPERVADARLAPVLPLLAPEPQPVALAAVSPSVGKKERRRRGRERPGRVEMASLTQPTGRAPVAAVTAATAVNPPVRPLPQPPHTASVPYQAAGPTRARVQPLPANNGPPASTVVASNITPAPVGGRAPARRASDAPAVSAPVAASVSTQTAASPPTVERGVAAVRPAGTVQAPGVEPVRTQVASIPSSAVRNVPPSPGSGNTPVTSPVQVAASSSSASVSQTRDPASTAVSAPAAVTVATGPAGPSEPTSSFTRPPSREEADSVLARIVAGLSIPAEELGVTGPEKPAPLAAMPATDTAARVVAEAKAKEERDAAAQKALAAKALADKRGADRKALADRKAFAAKKVADEEKLADARVAAEEKKAARANPGRVWVQVSGGAYVGDLPKAWAAVKAKAPAAMAGRQGWTTPLRATNRVLTGPFKTDAEARTFVNQLAKSGVSAFAFTSEAGQAVTRLAK